MTYDVPMIFYDKNIDSFGKQPANFWLNNPAWIKKLIENSSNLICIVQEGKITYMNQTGLDLLKYYNLESLEGKLITDIIGERYQDLFKGAYELNALSSADKGICAILLTKFGQEIDAVINVTVINDIDNFIAVIEADDMTLLKEIARQKITAENLLKRSVIKDKTTGLPGKALFLDRLNMAIERSKRTFRDTKGKTHPQVVCMLLEIANIKKIKSIIGQINTDNLLYQLGANLKFALRGVDTVSYCETEGFWMILEGILSKSDIESIARRTIGILFQKSGFKDHRLELNGNIGISIYPFCAQTSAELEDMTFFALNKSKELGVNKFFITKNEDPSLL